MRRQMPPFILFPLLTLGWIALTIWPRALNKSERMKVTGSIKDNQQGLYAADVPTAPIGLMGVNFYESHFGKKKWHIQSQSAELHRKENYAFMRTVSADFFSEKTGNKVETRSDFGRSLIDKQKIDLEGNVTIRSKRGYLFEMNRLAYDGVSHELLTEEPVSMKGPSVADPTMRLRGTGLLGNIDTEHFLLKKNVTALRRLKNHESLKIRSTSGEFFTEEQRAVFIGKVQASLPKMDIESDIFELGVGESAESILARGNVRLRQREMLGRAESVGMEVGGSRIVLEGNARIDSKDNQISGRRIVVFPDEDRIEVEAAEGSVK